MMLSPLTPFSRWVGNQPVIPEFYFDVKTEEQRYKRLAAILEELEKYVNYMVDAFNELYEEFLALKARVEELEQRMDEAEHRLDVLEERLDAVEEGIRQFYEEFTAFVEKTEKHFDEVDSRLDALEGRMDSAEGRLDALEASVEKLRDEFDTFVTQTNEHLATVDSRLDALEQTTTDAQTELSALAEAYKNFTVGDYLRLTETEEAEGFAAYTVDDAPMPHMSALQSAPLDNDIEVNLPLFGCNYNGHIDEDATSLPMYSNNQWKFDNTGKMILAPVATNSSTYPPDALLGVIGDNENSFSEIGLASKKMLSDITDAVDVANDALETAKIAAGGGVTHTEGKNGIDTVIEDRDGLFWLIADGKELSDKVDTAQAAADKAQETADNAQAAADDAQKAADEAKALANTKVTNLSAETPIEALRTDNDVNLKLSRTLLERLALVYITVPRFSSSQSSTGSSFDFTFSIDAVYENMSVQIEAVFSQSAYTYYFDLFDGNEITYELPYGNLTCDVKKNDVGSFEINVTGSNTSSNSTTVNIQISSAEIPVFDMS